MRFSSVCFTLTLDGSGMFWNSRDLKRILNLFKCAYGAVLYAGDFPTTGQSKKKHFRTFSIHRSRKSAVCIFAKQCSTKFKGTCPYFDNAPRGAHEQRVTQNVLGSRSKGGSTSPRGWEAQSGMSWPWVNHGVQARIQGGWRWGGRPPLGRRYTIEDTLFNTIQAPVNHWTPFPGRNPVSAPGLCVFEGSASVWRSITALQSATGAAFSAGAVAVAMRLPMATSTTSLEWGGVGAGAGSLRRLSRLSRLGPAVGLYRPGPAAPVAGREGVAGKLDPSPDLGQHVTNLSHGWTKRWTLYRLSPTRDPTWALSRVSTAHSTVSTPPKHSPSSASHSAAASESRAGARFAASHSRLRLRTRPDSQALGKPRPGSIVQVTSGVKTVRLRLGKGTGWAVSECRGRLRTEATTEVSGADWTWTG